MALVGLYGDQRICLIYTNLGSPNDESDGDENVMNDAWKNYYMSILVNLYCPCVY